MPNVLKNLDLEKIKTMELHDILKLLNKDKKEQYVMGIKVRAVMKKKNLMQLPLNGKRLSMKLKKIEKMVLKIQD